MTGLATTLTLALALAPAQPAAASAAVSPPTAPTAPTTPSSSGILPQPTPSLPAVAAPRPAPPAPPGGAPGSVPPAPSEVAPQSSVSPQSSATTPGDDCGGDFRAWLARVRVQAQAAGLADGTVALLDAVRSDARVLARDRFQGVFGQDFRTFSGRMVNDYRLKAGRRHLARYADAFLAAERTIGVPAAPIAALWGLETDYGAVQGDFGTLDALATLAHDCRRPLLFRPQLLAALALVERGHLDAAGLRGAWAGELGQLQVLPADYLELGTDGDGDGRVDLHASKPDTIFTGARLLGHLGWRAGEPWLAEVRIPRDLPWERLGPESANPPDQWARWGVRAASGDELPGAGLPATLLLPQGRKGPAFLAYRNFGVFLRWNRSLVYATTAAYFATRLAGAPAADMGHPDPGLSPAQIADLQGRLAGRGYDLGPIDGKLGAKTREAVRLEQLRLGLPADAWPTPALLSALDP
jgi:lytic murein transglycosylase